MNNKRIASELVRVAELITASKLNIKGKGRGRDIGAQVWNDISTQDAGIGKVLGYVLTGTPKKTLNIKSKGSAGTQTGVWFDWYTFGENKEILREGLKKAGWREKGNSWVHSGTPFELIVNDKHSLGSLIFQLSDDYSYQYDSKKKWWKVFQNGKQVY